MQMCSLRDAGTELKGAKIRVVGISVDDVALLGKFTKAEKLGFPLLSDPDGSAAKKYDALHKSGIFTNRVTYFVDPQGVLRAIDNKVDVRAHGTAVLARVKSLSAK